jgi:hypothetical protein
VVSALRDGITAVNRSPIILLSVFAVMLIIALPLALTIRSAIGTHLGSSLTGEQAARGVHVQWWTEFTGQAGELGSTFRMTIIGFAAVLDNVSTLADAISRPSAIVWAGAAYLLVWLYLSGGILDRYARRRPTQPAEFFAACGVFFVRFLRLAPFVVIAYYTVFGIVHPLLFGNLYEALVHDVTSDRTALVIRSGLYLVFGIVLSVVTIVFDYARVRAVVEDRRSMVGALLAGVRFVRRNAAGVAGLYLMTLGLFVAVLLLYALVAPGGAASGLGVWMGFAISQVYLLGRLWVRLVFLASETALFQGRLAHAGYAARAPLPVSEPPSVETAIGDRGVRL